MFFHLCCLFPRHCGTYDVCLPYRHFPFRQWLPVCHLQGLSGPCLKPFPLPLTKGVTLRLKNGGSFGVEVLLVLGAFCLLVCCFLFFHFLNLFIESLLLVRHGASQLQSQHLGAWGGRIAVSSLLSILNYKVSLCLGNRKRSGVGRVRREKRGWEGLVLKNGCLGQLQVPGFRAQAPSSGS